MLLNVLREPPGIRAAQLQERSVVCGGHGNVWHVSISTLTCYQDHRYMGPALRPLEIFATPCTPLKLSALTISELQK